MDGIAKSAPQPVESQEAPRVNDTKEPLTMFSGIPLELARSLGEDLNSLEGKRLDKVKEVFSFFNEEGKDFEEIMADIMQMQMKLGYPKGNETKLDKLWNWMTIRRKISNLNRQEEMMING